MKSRLLIIISLLALNSTELYGQDCERVLEFARSREVRFSSESSFSRDHEQFKNVLEHDGFVGIPLEGAELGIDGTWDYSTLRNKLKERWFSRKNMLALYGLDKQASELYKTCLDNHTGLHYGAWLIDRDEFQVSVNFSSPTQKVTEVTGELIVDGGSCSKLGGSIDLANVQIVTGSSVEFSCEWSSGKNSAFVKFKTSDCNTVPSKGLRVLRPEKAMYSIAFAQAQYSTRIHTNSVNKARVPCRRYLVAPISTRKGKTTWVWYKNAGLPHFRVEVNSEEEAPDPEVSVGVVELGTGFKMGVLLGKLSALRNKEEITMTSRTLKNDEILVLRVGNTEAVLYEPDEDWLDGCAERGENLTVVTQEARFSFVSRTR